MNQWKIGSRCTTKSGTGEITHLGKSIARIRLDTGGYYRALVSDLKHPTAHRTDKQTRLLAAAMVQTGLSESEIYRRARMCGLTLVETCEALLEYD